MTPPMRYAGLDVTTLGSRIENGRPGHGFFIPRSHPVYPEGPCLSGSWCGRHHINNSNIWLISSRPGSTLTSRFHAHVPVPRSTSRFHAPVPRFTSRFYAWLISSRPGSTLQLLRGQTNLGPSSFRVPPLIRWDSANIIAPPVARCVHRSSRPRQSPLSSRLWDSLPRASA